MSAVSDYKHGNITRKYPPILVANNNNKKVACGESSIAEFEEKQRQKRNREMLIKQQSIELANA